MIALPLIALVAHVSAEPHFRFDMGRSDSPLAEGWTPVLPDAVYSADRGYGWSREADSAFDRPETLPLTDVARDGVVAKEDITFRFDVPKGRWRVKVTIGDGREHRERMDVSVNGEQIADDIATRWTSWHGYATYRTIATNTAAIDGHIEVAFHHDHVCNSVLSVEAMEHVPLDVSGAVDEPVDVAEMLSKLMRERVEPDEMLWWALVISYFAGDIRIETSVYRKYVDDTFLDEQALLAAERGLRWAIEQDPHQPGLLERLDLARTMREGLFYSRLRSYSAQAARVPEHSKREKLAMDRFEQIPEGDPLYLKAQLILGQIHYWIGREGGSQGEYQAAERHFNTVAKYHSNHRLVRMYLGGKVDWGTEYTQGTEGAPAWAIEQREAMCRVLDVINYWVEERQIENGEMGGWWGDDCEMLRMWPVTVLGADDPVPLKGMRRLADGIWEKSGIIENGYNRSRGDVQHTAEPVSDTQPFMIGADYGAPRFVERCMQTTRLLRDLFTGVNEHGHRHFRSTEIGTVGIDENPPVAVDLPYCARAMKPAMWLAWYNRNPEAVDLLTSWSRAWCEDSLRTDRAKPAGIPPGAIAFATEALGGYGDNWHDPKLYWSYFRWPGALQLLFEQLLCTYELTGDRSFVAPIEACLDLVTKYHPDYPEGPGGSEKWAARALAGFVDQYAKWRLLTGDEKYDEFLKQRGPAYLRFRLTGDTKPLAQACESIINTTRHNFEMLTGEVRYTDRIAIGNTNHLFSMYTGGSGNASYYPSYAVTWKGVTKNFAAFVVDDSDEHVRVWAHSFEPHAVEARVHFWRLKPGDYRIRHGADENHDGEFDAEPASATTYFLHRGSWRSFVLPPRRTRIIDVEFLRPIRPLPERLPDLALSARDVALKKLGDEYEISVPVHNTGSADAGDVRVTVRDPGDMRMGSALYRETIPRLPAPTDLQSSIAEIRATMKLPEGTERIHITVWMADEDAKEINDANNEVIVPVPGR